MTDRELMQQALDVIELPITVGEIKREKTIKALRERLEQPEPVQFKCTVVDDNHPDGVPLSKWGRHSEQEPFCYHDGRNIVGKEYADHSDVFPLYTAQPKQNEFNPDWDAMGVMVAEQQRMALEIDALRWRLKSVNTAAMKLTSDLTCMEVDDGERLDRDRVMERVVQWRNEWDKAMHGIKVEA